MLFYLWKRICKTVVLSIPVGAVEEQSVDVDAFLGSFVDVLEVVLGDIVGEGDGIERPTLVHSGDFLSHGGQETLRVEESSHPERLWSTFEAPRAELEIF